MINYISHSSKKGEVLASRNDFKMNTCSVHQSGTLLLDMSHMMLLEKTLAECISIQGTVICTVHVDRFIYCREDIGMYVGNFSMYVLKFFELNKEYIYSGAVWEFE